MRAGTRAGFVDDYLTPLGASIWSADPLRFTEFPVAPFARFLYRHGLLAFGGRPEWRTVSGGSFEYVRRLTHPWRDRIRTGCAVRSIERDDEGVVIHSGSHPDGERFDKVVLATHADVSLQLLSRANSTGTGDTGRVPLPTKPNHAAHGPKPAATAPARMGELELPPESKRSSRCRFSPITQTASRDCVRRPTTASRSTRTEPSTRRESWRPTTTRIRYSTSLHCKLAAAGRDRRPPQHPLRRRVLGVRLPRGRRAQSALTTTELLTSRAPRREPVLAR